jgi:hypothetical protein
MAYAVGDTAGFFNGFAATEDENDDDDGGGGGGGVGGGGNVLLQSQLSSTTTIMHSNIRGVTMEHLLLSWEWVPRACT